MLHALITGPAMQLSILLSLIDIAAGMSYLHSIGLLHSDLKGGNVLLKSCAPSKADPRGFVCKVPHPELLSLNLPSCLRVAPSYASDYNIMLKSCWLKIPHATMCCSYIQWDRQTYFIE